jgi:hypothetical protein
MLLIVETIRKLCALYRLLGKKEWLPIYANARFYCGLVHCRVKVGLDLPFLFREIAMKCLLEYISRGDDILT